MHLALERKSLGVAKKGYNFRLVSCGIELLQEIEILMVNAEAREGVLRQS